MYKYCDNIIIGNKSAFAIVRLLGTDFLMKTRHFGQSKKQNPLDTQE